MSYGRARAPVVAETATALLVRDEFDQTTGALTGKALPVGAGSWSELGSTGGYTVEAAGSYPHTAQRATTTDIGGVPAQGGRIAIAGTTSLTASLVTLDVKASALTTNLVMGLIARATDVNNFLGLHLLNTSFGGGLQLSRWVAGTRSQMVYFPFAFSSGSSYTIKLSVDTTGTINAWVYVTGGVPGTAQISTSHADLSSSGALASGKVGLIDGNMTAATASTRIYDNLSATTWSSPAVLYSGRTSRFTHEAAYRQNAAGTSEGRVPAFEGKYPTFPPATRAGRTSRLVIKARRNDVDSGLPDIGLSDSITGTLVVTPRVLLTSG